MKVTRSVNFPLALFMLFASCVATAQATQPEVEQAFLDELQRMRSLVLEYQSVISPGSPYISPGDKAKLVEKTIQAADSTVELSEQVLSPSSKTLALVRAEAALVYMTVTWAKSEHRQKSTELLESAIEIVEELEGKESPALIPLYRKLGDSKNEQRDPFNQPPLHDDYRSALKIAQKNFGNTSLEVADLQRDLSYFFVSRYLWHVPDYERYLRDALDIYRTLDNREAARRGFTAFHAGRIELSRNNPRRALEYYEEALAMMLEDPAGANQLSGSITSIHKDLVETYAALGDDEMAIAHAIELSRTTPFDPKNKYLSAPIYASPPRYPVEAANRGLEGYVVVRFTIDTNGKVKDPVVVESTSPVFAPQALEAARRMRYVPRVVDGERVETPDWTYKFTFELEK